MYASVRVIETPARNQREMYKSVQTDLETLMERFELEHICWDPKDGELCLNRAKPEETLVEARSDSDVQIDRQIWV